MRKPDINGHLGRVFKLKGDLKLVIIYSPNWQSWMAQVWNNDGYCISSEYGITIKQAIGRTRLGIHQYNNPRIKKVVDRMSNNNKIDFYGKSPIETMKDKFIDDLLEKGLEV